MTLATPQPLMQSDRQTRDRELFDNIAERYAYKDLHPTSSVARRQRLVRTLAAAKLPDRPDLLEAGCGAGFSARYLTGRFGRFVGIDYSDKLIECANQHNSVPNASFHAENIKDLDMVGHFDAVVMIGVLHHMDDMDTAMQQMVSTLKPGGWLLANEPQPGNPLIRAARHFRKRMDKDYSEEQDQISGSDLRKLYSAAGLTDIAVVPQGLFSTPFAEVPMGPAWLTHPVARASCLLDTVIEVTLRPLLGRVAWNLIARGRKP